MNKPYDYESLIKKFLNRNISVREFETTYLEKFKAEQARLNKTFDPLDWLFAEIDAYTNIPFDAANNPHGWVSEDQLRISAEKVLRELRNLKPE